jgi:hypothetical protein
MTWQSSTQPPGTSRRVMLRFDDSGGLDATGFYWRAEGAWYRSNGSKAKHKSVHPIQWRELTDERKEGGE